MHTTTRTAALGTLAALLLAAPAWAGSDDAGTSAANFLTLGTGPAVLAMGGAALGRSGQLDFASWNAGSLGFVDDTRIQLAHASLDDESMQEWAAIGGRFGKSQTHWAMSALYQYEGLMAGRDASNFVTEDFTVSTAAAMVQLAQSFGPHAAFGLTGKYVLDDMGIARRGSGMTFDGGLSLRFGAFGFGVAGQNVGGKMTYGSESYPFPTSYGGGVSYTHAHTGLTGALDVNLPSTSFTSVRTGVEWNWKQRVAMRMGYRAELGAPADEPMSGPTFGMGCAVRSMRLDYGFLMNGQLNGQHRLALTLGSPGFKWKSGDPFGQGSMPRDFDTPPKKQQKILGPPAPDTKKSTTPTKN